jgi:glycosyltransferase involved in cell wall biosynthesis
MFSDAEMKICHVVYECFPGTFAGGVQKMVAELATAQARAGNLVSVWTIGDHADRELTGGGLIRYFPGRVRWGSRAMSRALREHHMEFDIIHAHNTFLPLNRVVAAVAQCGARVYFHAHGALDPQLLAGWRNPKAIKKRLYVTAFERRNYDAAQAVFGLTETECRQIEAIGTKSAIFEVSNGINDQPPPVPTGAAAFRLKHHIPIEAPLILFIGRITHKKGLHHLVDTMPQILARVPGALLAICGDRSQDVDYVRALDGQIGRLKIDERIRWVGFLDEVGKRAAFAACHVFAHPSYSEGMALAILEAMAAGAATVVTPGCYMGAAVRAGALAESPQDPASLAAAIIRLLTDPQETARVRAAGVAYVRQHHTWDVVARRLDQIYRGDPAVLPFRPAQKF